MGRRNKICIIAAAVCSLAGGSARADAHKFLVDAAGGSSIQFVSDAPLEKFTGKTSTLSGHVTVDVEHLDTGKGEIDADTASIKTHLELRDEHLAGESWLDAKKYPVARFVITKINGQPKLKHNDVTEVTVTGKFTLHGVTKELTTHAKVRYTPGAKASLRIQTAFTIHLEDYKISIPKLVSLKVSPDIVVNVDIHASASTNSGVR